jgi:hypothetical protein
VLAAESNPRGGDDTWFRVEVANAARKEGRKELADCVFGSDQAAAQEDQDPAKGDVALTNSGLAFRSSPLLSWRLRGPTRFTIRLVDDVKSGVQLDLRLNASPSRRVIQRLPASHPLPTKLVLDLRTRHQRSPKPRDAPPRNAASRWTILPRFVRARFKGIRRAWYSLRNSGEEGEEEVERCRCGGYGG